MSGGGEAGQREGYGQYGYKNGVNWGAIMAFLMAKRAL
jgi:cytosine/uracil/thiamine/allantoin permease